MSRKRNQRRPMGRPAKRPRPARPTFVQRPFEGLAGEPDWIALRELVPAATAPLQLAESYRQQFGERTVTLATLLPMALPAMVQPDGSVFVALQRDVNSADANRDVAAALLAALDAAPGGSVSVPTEPGDGPRLGDILADAPLEVSVHERLDFWVTGDVDDPAITASLERANESIYPTARMPGERAAYWCQVADKAHLRWVLAEPEQTALPALARVSAADGMRLSDDARFAGMFRAHGLLIPVWDLPRDAPADRWEKPLAAFAERYAEALTVSGELTAEQRRARQGLIGRQLTIR